jgi:4-amino-4-deoxy-L-arabinose transferase-like glycosyltransferase
MKSAARTSKVKRAAEPRSSVDMPQNGTPAGAAAGTPVAAPGILKTWTSSRSRVFLFVLTVLCLAPFLGCAFHIDDTLTLWAAKHIAAHPFDPYGFPVVWYNTGMPMSEVTKNPPFAAYYCALIGSLAGWSESALHLAFLFPALAVVLGLYHLARDLTQSPLLAAVLTLVAPGFLVSSTSIMCDVPMLALWVVAVIQWRKGLESGQPLYLATGGLLIAASALAKYFGACLIPLLFLYSVWRKRGLGIWALYFLIPIAALGGYQIWTQSLYGRGLLFDAAAYVGQAQAQHPLSLFGASLVGLSFLGGCSLPALTCVPWLWRKKWMIFVLATAAIGTVVGAREWVSIGPFPSEHRVSLGFQLMAYLAGGISVFALALSDFRRRRDADSVFLLAWVIGTFIFAAYLNWTINARSVLPLIPAVAILIARSLDEAKQRSHLPPWLLVTPVLLTGLLSLWVARGDAALANSARRAAEIIHGEKVSPPGKVFFSGHWGFQYYMEAFGAQPLELDKRNVTAADLIIQPANNTNRVRIPEGMIDSSELVTIDGKQWVTTLREDRAAGFYSSIWGPLPFAFGPVPPEEYRLIRLRPAYAPPSFPSNY